MAEVLSGTEGGIVMTVGARAHDTLAPFLTGGLTVHALAPDTTTAVGAGPRAHPKPDRGSADHVATTTICQLIKERRLSRLDLLMVDSPHRGILQDVAWAECRPRFVMCAFDEHEARPAGHSLHDVAGLLVAHGYRVWVSEWHPPTRFGPKFMKAGRRWRRLVPYPCHLGSPRGYCIATRETADLEALAEAARRAIERPSPNRSIPWLGLTFQRSVPKVQRGVTKVKRRARALSNRARAGLVSYLDGHHPDASASLRATLGRLLCLSAPARPAILIVSSGRTYNDIADPAAGAARRLRPARYWLDGWLYRRTDHARALARLKHCHEGRPPPGGRQRAEPEPHPPRRGL